MLLRDRGAGAWWPLPWPAPCPASAGGGLRWLLGKHRFDLGLEGLGVERFDDVVIHARLLGRDDVFGLRLGGHHPERRSGQTRIGAARLDELVAGPRFLVPISIHQP